VEEVVVSGVVPDESEALLRLKSCNCSRQSSLRSESVVVPIWSRIRAIRPNRPASSLILADPEAISHRQSFLDPATERSPAGRPRRAETTRISFAKAATPGLEMSLVGRILSARDVMSASSHLRKGETHGFEAP
jgi:hypothetical protein